MTSQYNRNKHDQWTGLPGDGSPVYSKNPVVELETLYWLAIDHGLLQAADWMMARMTTTPKKPPEPGRDPRLTPTNRHVGLTDMPQTESWHKTVPPWEDPT